MCGLIYRCLYRDGGKIPAAVWSDQNIFVLRPVKTSEGTFDKQRVIADLVTAFKMYEIAITHHCFFR